jgi:hypothetical protein
MWTSSSDLHLAERKTGPLVRFCVLLWFLSYADAGAWVCLTLPLPVLQKWVGRKLQLKVFI